MRRNNTPRRTLDINFRRASNLTKILKGKRNAPAADFDDLVAMLEETISDLRDLSVDFAQEAPSVGSSTIAQLINGHDPVSVRRFVRRHLDAEFSILRIKGAIAAELAQASETALMTMDGCSDADIHAASHKVLAALPTIEAPVFSREQIEIVMREALGLDGRVPVTEAPTDADRQAVLALLKAQQAVAA